MNRPTWLDRVEPPVPASFRPWLELPVPARSDVRARRDGSEGVLPDSDRLERAALEALKRALTPGGRERRGAFDLLAADAFVTWAAEAALDEEDPEARLRSLVRRMAGGTGPSAGESG